jgi:hypothetical protein
MDTSDESILNNHHTVPTLELIDVDGFDYYSTSNPPTTVSER